MFLVRWSYTQRGWQKSFYLLNGAESLRALNPVVTACAAARHWRRALYLAKNAVALVAACGAVDMAGNVGMLPKALVELQKASGLMLAKSGSWDGVTCLFPGGRRGCKRTTSWDSGAVESCAAWGATWTWVRRKDTLHEPLAFKHSLTRVFAARPWLTRSPRRARSAARTWL